MSESVVRMEAACCPAANNAAYSASPALATMQGIMMVENSWIDPLILVGSLWLPRKSIAPATDRECERHKYDASENAWITMSQA